MGTGSSCSRKKKLEDMTLWGRENSYGVCGGAGRRGGKTGTRFQLSVKKGFQTDRTNPERKEHRESQLPFLEGS